MPSLGGVSNAGNMTAMNSTISQNKAGTDGVGLYNSYNGYSSGLNTTNVFNGADYE
jgi:hypothetical protein